MPATPTMVESLGYNVGDAAFPQTKYTSEEKAKIVEAAKSAGWIPWK